MHGGSARMRLNYREREPTVLKLTTKRLTQTGIDVLYSYALAWMPLGFAIWLTGMHLRSYAIAAGGFLLSVVGAYAWTDDSRNERPSETP